MAKNLYKCSNLAISLGILREIQSGGHTEVCGENGRLGLADIRRTYVGHIMADIRWTYGGFMADGHWSVAYDEHTVVGGHTTNIRRTCAKNGCGHTANIRWTYAIMIFLFHNKYKADMQQTYANMIYLIIL